jgi:hypothetical protein
MSISFPQKSVSIEPLSHDSPPSNRSRIEYAIQSITEMAAEAVRNRQSGTIGIEMSVKSGRLGKVKRVRIDFQPE